MTGYSKSIVISDDRNFFRKPVACDNFVDILKNYFSAKPVAEKKVREKDCYEQCKSITSDCGIILLCMGACGRHRITAPPKSRESRIEMKCSECIFDMPLGLTGFDECKRLCNIQGSPIDEELLKTYLVPSVAVQECKDKCRLEPLTVNFLSCVRKCPQHGGKTEFTPEKVSVPPVTVREVGEV